MRDPEIILYKTTAQADLHVHVFRPDDNGAGRRRPAIVFFFCGRWRGFNATKFYPQCEYLVTRGVVCVNAEVRVERHGTTPAECVTGAKSAIRWTRRHEAELGIDPSRTAAGGGSAAGMVTGCLGTVDGFDDPEDDLSVSALPDALIMFNPALDMTDTERRVNYCGGIDRACSLSPLHHVWAGMPPSLAMHARDDARGAGSAIH